MLNHITSTFGRETSRNVRWAEPRSARCEASSKKKSTRGDLEDWQTAARGAGREQVLGEEQGFVRREATRGIRVRSSAAG